MWFQLLFEILLLVGVIYLIWRLIIRPRAETFVRTRENSRLQEKMEFLKQKKSDLQNLQDERDVTKELQDILEEERGVQEELDDLEKKDIN